MKYWQVLLKLVRSNPWLYVLNVILSIAGWLLFIVPAIVSQKFFDLLPSYNGEFTIWFLILLLTAGHIFRMIVFLLNRYVDVTFTQKIASLLRKNMMFSYYRKHTSKQSSEHGETLNRFREDVENTSMFLGMIYFLDVLGAAVFSSIALYMMISVDVYITLLVFIPLVIVILCIQWFRKRIEKLQRNMREATGRVSAFIGQIFSVVKAVQVAGAEQHVKKKFLEINKERQRIAVKESVTDAFIQSTYFNIVQIGTGLILLLTASKMSANQFTPGDFAMFIYYLTWVTQMIVRFGGLSAAYQRVGVSIDRMKDICINPNDLVQSNHNDYEQAKLDKSKLEPLEVLNIKNLNYKYPNSNKGLKNINLTIKRGTVTVISGKIGSGKSTLIKALTGALPINAGSLYWNNMMIEQPSESFIPKHVVSIPQTPVLFNETIKANICLEDSVLESKVEEVVQIAKLNEDIALFEEGTEFMVGSRGSKLSGGQCQRVSIARGLIRESEIFIFDQVSNALDINTEMALWNNILERFSKHTLIIVSHQTFLLKRADQVIVMDEGEIVGIGKYNELIENSDELKKVWNE